MIQQSTYFKYFKPSEFDGNPLFELDTSKLSRQEWLAIRTALPSIGGSDVGTILGLNPYKDAIRLFYQKIGVYPSTFKDNRFTYWGRMLEDKVVESWKHWDGDEESMIDNESKGVKIRDGKPRHGMLWNPKYPQLVSNLDYQITLHPVYKPNGVLEAKTISGFAADKWDDGLPTYYIPQPFSYMMTTGAPFAEFAVLCDGREFNVHTFEWRDSTVNMISRAIEEFYWRMTEGFKIVKKIKNRQKALQELSEVEPEPTGSEDYGQFLSEKQKEMSAKTIRDATEEERLVVLEFKRIRDKHRRLGTELQDRTNKIKKLMSSSYTRKIILPNNEGTVSFNKKFIVK